MGRPFVSRAGTAGVDFLGFEVLGSAGMRCVLVETLFLAIVGLWGRAMVGGFRINTVR